MNIKVKMSIKKKQCYFAPSIERMHLAQPLNLLVSVSMEGGIEDWEEGDEL